jgi:hypothetical protein
LGKRFTGLASDVTSSSIKYQMDSGIFSNLW